MKNIAVIFGGKSTEHDISILSANLVMKILKDDMNIIPIYITKTNEFYTGDMLDTKVFKEFNEKKFIQISFVKNQIFKVKRKKLKYYKTLDAVIPIMHGKNGEDGTLQGMLELLEIPYTQSGVLASGLTLDKLYTKYILKELNIPYVDYYCIQKNENYDIEEIVNILGFPLIIKPSNLGSSIGISKVNSLEELDTAIDLAFMFDEKLLIERCLEEFKEYNISVFKTQKGIETSLIEQPLSKQDILTFQDKYKTKTGKGMEGLDRIFPAQIDDNLKTEIETYAKKAYKGFNMKGVVRIDFLYKDRIYLNEINSIPGSMAYYLWKDKYTFKELMLTLLKQAEIDFKVKNKSTSYFDGTVL